MLNKPAAAKARAPAQQGGYDCQFIPNFLANYSLAAAEEK
jgi:hypothetical protein